MSIITPDAVHNAISDDVLAACLYSEAVPDTSGIDTLIQAVLDRVDGLVWGYLRGRYSVPLDPAPDPLPYLAGQLAVYDILNNRGLSDKDPADLSAIRGRKEAIRTLEMIAAGKITLDETTVPAPERNLTPEIEGPDRVFSRDKMKGF